MTKKEAIEIMARRIFMSKYEQAIKVLKILYSDKFQQFTSSEFDDAIYVAIEALEKQLPMEPDYEGDGYADGELVYDTWICPNCGRHYEVDYDDYEYCPQCGQRIDWSGEDET